jgi:endonuclease YncB( thermonuclease family)
MKKLIILLLVLFACSDSFTIGKIIRVIDGDTFVFQNSNSIFRVRMLDIDAPELSQTFGLKSKDYLQRYLDKRAKMYCKGKDCYNRTLAVLYVDGLNINEQMIKYGYAYFNHKWSDNFELMKLEYTAKINKVGLWNYDTCSPWIYRKQHKNK